MSNSNKNLRTPSLQEIIDVIGDEAAAELVKQIGGVTYHFPADGRQSRHVSIRSESWAAMCKHFAGWVYVPKGMIDKLAARNEEIREKRRTGAHIIDLALEYGLSDRQIRTICGGVRIESGSHASQQTLGLKKPFSC